MGRVGNGGVYYYNADRTDPYGFYRTLARTTEDCGVQKDF